MQKLKPLFISLIFLGLIIAEAVPVVSKMISPAHSGRGLTSAEQNLISSILQAPSDTATPVLKGDFLDFSIPTNPGQVSKDAILSSGFIGNSNMSALAPLPSGASNNEILAGVLPPVGSDLYYAYQDGGRLWYEKGTNVLVLSSGEVIKSYDKKTGEQTNWMQDRLAYPPITDPSAYTNYPKNYNAQIVAETTQWVLMEFPSGGLIKVVKPQYTAPASGGGTIYGLPNILPGYE